MAMERESQIVIRFDRDTLRQYRAECMRRGLTPSSNLAHLMQEQLSRWLQDNAATLSRTQEVGP